MSPGQNPYQPPAAAVNLPADSISGDAEAIRREHLKTEVNIQGIGCLWMLAFPAAVAVLASVVLPLMSANGKSGTAGSGGLEVLIGVVLGVIMLIQGVVGVMLRRLQPSARIPAIVLATLGLVGFPVGTLISLLILLILCRAKGKRVLSPGYKEIIAATPTIKYRTPTWLWVVLILFLLAVVAAFAIPLLRQP